MIAHFSVGWATEAGQAVLGCLIIVGFVLGHLQSGHTKDKIEQVHVLVNSQMANALQRIEELEKALGIAPDAPVPPPRKKRAPKRVPK